MNDESRWKCDVCGWIGVDSQILEATSPFRDDDIITACPQCRMTEGFTELCQFCDSASSCGTPMKDGFATFSGDDSRDGYVRTCGKHRPKEKQ